MKSDLQLKSDVTAELAWDPAVDPTSVGIAVKDGIVTRSGMADTCLHALRRHSLVPEDKITVQVEDVTRIIDRPQVGA